MMRRHESRGPRKRWSKREKPKNDFVPIPWSAHRRMDLREPPGHEAFLPDRLTGWLALEIEALSPLHVGAGRLDEHGETLAKATMLREGRPIVPGSSIKGACRQLHEALTGSAPPDWELWEEKPGAEKSEKVSGTELARQSGGSALLFGAPGWLGRVSFDDAVPVDEVEPEVCRVRVPYAPLGDWKPEDSKKSRSRNDQEGKKPPPHDRQGRRFYGIFQTRLPPNEKRSVRVFTIPRGTRLLTRLHFRNLEPFELGTVLVALGLGATKFTPKLGGCKYEPLGWVRYAPREHALRRGLAKIEIGSDERFWREAIEAAEQGSRSRKDWSKVLGDCKERLRAENDLERPR